MLKLSQVEGQPRTPFSYRPAFSPSNCGAFIFKRSNQLTEGKGNYVPLQKLENTIDQITEELKTEDLAPPDLGRIYTQLSGWYSFYGQRLKRIQLEKPAKWLAIQSTPEKPLSDKKTEMTWNATGEGRKEMALEWELKRIEKMMSAINKRLYVDNIAARNQY